MSSDGNQRGDFNYSERLLSLFDAAQAYRGRSTKRLGGVVPGGRHKGWLSPIPRAQICGRNLFLADSDAAPRLAERRSGSSHASAWRPNASASVRAMLGQTNGLADETAVILRGLAEL